MNTELLIIEHQEGAAVIKLNHGVTNAINSELVHELASTLENLTGDDDVLGMVLTSANEKFFSIGLDIPSLYDLPEEAFRAFYQSYNQLCLVILTCPKPIVAAITGHAIAGGYILALCCDYRSVAAGRKFVGLNEIKLGVPVPFVADCTLRRLVGHRIARDIMDSGEFYEPAEALQLGLVDHVVSADEIIGFSTMKVQAIASASLPAFSLIKNNRIRPINAEIQASLLVREEAFIERWYSSDTRHQLEEAMSKF
ncbi:MAG: enoyl-CoA hydratase/isomerase family protein [Anaerolineales bacterium]|nr:enoyl-CoA hydratase/isomerase family protein [Anaerolineales bacterium]